MVGRSGNVACRFEEILGGVGITKLGGGFLRPEGELFQVVILATEVNDILDRAEVAICVRIVDIIEVEPVFASGGGLLKWGTDALGWVVAVSSGVFLTTVFPVDMFVLAVDEFSEDIGPEILFGCVFGDRCQCRDFWFM